MQANSGDPQRPNGEVNGDNERNRADRAIRIAVCICLLGSLGGCAAQLVYDLGNPSIHAPTYLPAGIALGAVVGSIVGWIVYRVSVSKQ